MNAWLKDNPVYSILINIFLSLIIGSILIMFYVDNQMDVKIDDRIINEYQKPIIDKLDILINLYNDEQRDGN